jgi:cyclophilin family peptidyl-prolyl cis-trans isomerase
MIMMTHRAIRWAMAGMGLAWMAGCAPQAVETSAAPDATPATPDAGLPQAAVIRTSMGEIEIEFLGDQAPETVANFAAYARSGHYAGTIFHRVIEGFMIQGGGMTSDLREKRTRAPVRNEATNRVPNARGTVAMARTPHPDSATAQFFINVADNRMLDHRAPTHDGFGYCVFARVTRGMDVVDRIKAVPTTSLGPHENVPAKPVEIESVELR